MAGSVSEVAHGGTCNVEPPPRLPVLAFIWTWAPIQTRPLSDKVPWRCVRQ